MKKINKKFEELLKKNNYTAYSLGKILGVSNPTVYYWLWGKSVPKVSMLLKLTEILHVSAEEILKIFSEKIREKEK